MDISVGGEFAGTVRSNRARSLGAAPYIRLAPIVVVAGFSVLIAIPATRRGAYWLVAENRPVELITFFAALAAAVQGWRLTWAHRRARTAPWVVAFFATFTFGMLFVAGEEIAWGQQFCRFDTPPALAQINRQGELTLHNLGPMQGHNDLLRLSFGVGGLIGLWLGRARIMRAVAPQPILFNWFAVILIVALVDTLCDLSGMTRRGWEFGHRLSEVVELFIAVSALLYVHFHLTGLRQRADSPRPID